MPVTETSKLYQSNINKWRLVRDCCEGSQAIKAGRQIENNSATALGSEPGTLYLPAPNPEDNSNTNRLRYIAYRTRANFVNFVGHTLEALIGMVCRKEPKIELPVSIESMQYDVNGEGESLYSAMKRTLSEVLKAGQQGILTDYPTTEEGLTQAQTANIKPFLKAYRAESIINYRTITVAGRSMLSLVVLMEEIDVYTDEFSSEPAKQYRVLKLNDDGVYIQQLYNQDGEILVDEQGETDVIPRDAAGNVWREIPFVFIGAMNNDPVPDKSPLYDLAEINISHYRNSADYEESCFLVGQPTPVLSGLTQSWVKDVLKNEVNLGSRAVIPLPEGGSATLLQAASNQMPAEGMIMKEKQMIQIGAKIITDSGGVETAEAAKIRFAGQNSKLGTIVGNINEGYEKLLEFAIMFAGGNIDGVEIELNTEFYDKVIDPQLLMAKIQLLDRQVISIADVRDHLRKSGDIDQDRDDQDIDDDIGEIDPLV